MEIDTATLLIAICANSLACLGLMLMTYFQTDNKITAIRQDMKQFHEDTKDFHGRLCALEERYIAFKMEQK